MNSSRQWEIDALRGLMLVLMTVTHLPTRLTSPLGQPFGFVSAAEGFVLLSAYMAGMVYSRIAYRGSIDSMRKAFWRRALKVYLCQAATLVFLFTVIAAVGITVDEPAVKNLMSFYLQRPLDALVAGLLLVYQPPLLDILPMYVLFMLASPWVLAWALHHRWRPVLLASFALWLLAQFGVGKIIYQAVSAWVGNPVPVKETSSFVVLAWQLLWAVGLWAGASRHAPDAKPFAFSPTVVRAAVVFALVCLVWRHVEGQAAFGAREMLNLVFDKWALGPLRLLDLMALSVVTLTYGPWLASRIPRPRWLEIMGAASLPVFCAHLVIVLLVLAFFGADPLTRPWWHDALLLLGCYTTLYGVALMSNWADVRYAGAMPVQPKAKKGAKLKVGGAQPMPAPPELPRPK